MITSAFTCTGPYAILIMLGIKRMENRSMMPVPAKGRCAVSCSKSFSREEYGNFVQWAAAHLPPEDFDRIPAWADVRDWPGRIVGACDYRAFIMKDGPVGGGPIPWNEGYEYWWDLSNIVCFDRPIPCRGNVGMWQMPSALAAQVTAVDQLAQSVGERVATAEDAARIFRLAMPVANGSEGFFVLPLDEERRVLAEPVMVALGEKATTIVQPGEVFGAAIGADAKAVIVAHNHPSGDTTPSVQDRQLTSALKKIGEALGVTVLDHLIIGGDSFAVV